MNNTMEKYKEPEENLHRFAKKEILKNLSAYMKDFIDVIDFTVVELDMQINNA